MCSLSGHFCTSHERWFRGDSKINNPVQCFGKGITQVLRLAGRHDSPPHLQGTGNSPYQLGEVPLLLQVFVGQDHIFQQAWAEPA